MGALTGSRMSAEYSKRVNAHHDRNAKLQDPLRDLGAKCLWAVSVDTCSALREESEEEIWSFSAQVRAFAMGLVTGARFRVLMRKFKNKRNDDLEYAL